MRLILFILSVTFLTGCFDKKKSDFTPQTAPVESNCSTLPNHIVWTDLLNKNCNRLSDYGLFQLNDPRSKPRKPGVEYFLSTELFTDYAKKHRFMFIPEGEVIQYKSRSALSFPVGSVLVKTFVLPSISDQQGIDMVETRLLIRREKGWVGLPYIWNADKTEAHLSLAGEHIEKTMQVKGVGITFDYQVPSIGDCRTCHIVREGDSSKTMPIGLKARHLNRQINTEAGEINQLEYWREKSLLVGLFMEPNEILSVPVWGDNDRLIQDRAKGYLDINCSHCHTPGGSGSESGMFLEYWRLPEYFDHGVCKRPGGFNGGDKGLVYDLIPGNAEDSLIPYRMSLLASEGDEKGQMPPLGRHLNHIEGIQLVKDWINSMNPRPCN